MPPYRHHCLPLPPYILFPIYILCNNKRHGSLRKPCLYFLTDWICRLSTSLPAEHKNRQYDNCKRTDTYYPVTVICPVHLLFVFHTLQTLFQLVIGFTFHTLLLSFTLMSQAPFIIAVFHSSASLFVPFSKTFLCCLIDFSDVNFYLFRFYCFYTCSI